MLLTEQGKAEKVKPNSIRAIFGQLIDCFMSEFIDFGKEEKWWESSSRKKFEKWKRVHQTDQSRD